MNSINRCDAVIFTENNPCNSSFSYNDFFNNFVKAANEKGITLDSDFNLIAVDLDARHYSSLIAFIQPEDDQFKFNNSHKKSSTILKALRNPEFFTCIEKILINPSPSSKPIPHTLYIPTPLFKSLRTVLKHFSLKSF